MYSSIWIGEIDGLFRQLCKQNSNKIHQVSSLNVNSQQTSLHRYDVDMGGGGAKAKDRNK